MSGWGVAIFSIVFYLCALQVAYAMAIMVVAWTPRQPWGPVFWLVIILSINIQVLVVH